MKTAKKEIFGIKSKELKMTNARITLAILDVLEGISLGQLKEVVDEFMRLYPEATIGTKKYLDILINYLDHNESVI